jgi:hypothetical protein
MVEKNGDIIEESTDRKVKLLLLLTDSTVRKRCMQFSTIDDEMR